MKARSLLETAVKAGVHQLVSNLLARDDDPLVNPARLWMKGKYTSMVADLQALKGRGDELLSAELERKEDGDFCAVRLGSIWMVVPAVVIEEERVITARILHAATGLCTIASNLSCLLTADGSNSWSWANTPNGFEIGGKVNKTAAVAAALVSRQGIFLRGPLETKNRNARVEAAIGRARVGLPCHGSQLLTGSKQGAYIADLKMLLDWNLRAKVEKFPLSVEGSGTR